MIVIVPACRAQVFELRVRHVRIHMIVVDMLEIYIVLSKDHEEINIVTHQMFRNLCIRLTKIEAINVLVSTHTVESSDVVLFLAGYIVEYDDGIGISVCR